MAKKEALSQFQSRLAGRLHSTEQLAADESASWLAVEISGAGFMFPLADAGEIFPWSVPQAIPYTKDWFLGVVNLRGALCGVVSLAKFFSLPDSADAQDAAKALQEKRLIGFHPSMDLNTVLSVDKLIGLKNKQQMMPTDMIGQYRDQQSQRWQEIDLRQLSQNPAFINIAQ
jgi:twitching motility protein PilI